MSSGFGSPVSVQSSTPNVSETTVNSTYLPSIRRVGPGLSAAIVTLPSVPIVLLSLNPLITNPPPSQPADDAALAGTAIGGANASPAKRISTPLARPSARET